MIGWTFAVIAVAISVSIALRINDWGRDLTQNSAALDANAQRVELRPVELPVNAEAVENQISRWVDASSTWALVSRSGDGEMAVSMKLTRTTAIMRFVDDIEISIVENADGSGVVVSATSRSRIGKGDLGQNPRNLMELTAALRQGS